FSLIGLLHGGHVGRQEVHFLSDPALDDLVVAIKAQSHSLAKQYLLRDLLIDKTLQLVPGQRRSPLRKPCDRHLTYVVCADLDLQSARRLLWFLVEEPIGAEQDRARGEEVDERLTEQ